MANPSVESAQPYMLQTAEPFRSEPEGLLQPRTLPPDRSGMWAMYFSAALSAFWIGSSSAYFVGYYGMKALGALALQQQVFVAVVCLLPPFLFVAAAWAMSRGIAMGSAAEVLAEATERIFTSDETTARTAARLGRAVRRELDALNAGLDGAFARLRALESVLEEQIAAVDEAGARLGVQSEAVAARISRERERIEGIASALADSATRASETVAGRAAQLKASIESAEGALRTAGQSLDVQASSFRQAAVLVAEAPRNAAIELDTQAKRIESVADAAMARAEFVLGRQERHRTAMADLVQRMKEESTGFEGALSAQRAGIEKAIAVLQTEGEKFGRVSEETDRQMEAIMALAPTRAAQVAQAYAREVEHLRETAEVSNAALARLVDALREAGDGAQALIGETTGQAKADAKALVGEAMAECERLLRTAGEMSIEAGAIRKTLANAVDDIERHILNLPALAQQEAQRVRQMVRTETEEMLDFSARTLSTIHARGVPRALQRTPQETSAPEKPDNDGLLGMARRVTQRKRRPSDSTDIRSRESKPWEMSALLAAADTSDDEYRSLKGAGPATALAALQAALAELAIDLEAIALEGEPSADAWRRYLKGEHGVFAHKIADEIDDRAVDRIASLYRDDQRFRDAANGYMAEFETMLSRAKEGDENGLLTSTVLSADTGKIYLAVAYALGRL
jgi:hypothetical protein